MDREGKDAFSLLDELEDKLDIKANKTKIVEDVVTIKDLSDAKLDEIIGESFGNELREEVEIINGVYDKFDRTKYLAAPKALWQIEAYLPPQLPTPRIWKQE
ncbi:hypothetical protein ANCCEY_15317 [Ancylostoma ceylanicum]|uniref:Uncharacterized protein n=1 Tax=Ancylostoma ceylanicum TaxID=53326 RepID=A0A0D6L7Q9_9BILA|nr:hypothetical protein ANCCEY_15317 [Ancylostoma ceylanicum]